MFSIYTVSIYPRVRILLFIVFTIPDNAFSSYLCNYRHIFVKLMTILWDFLETTSIASSVVLPWDFSSSTSWVKYVFLKVLILPSNLINFLSSLQAPLKLFLLVSFDLYLLGSPQSILLEGNNQGINLYFSCPLLLYCLWSLSKALVIYCV